MTIYALPGSIFVPYVTNAGTGNTGSVGLEIYDPATSTAIVPRFTAGIVETPADSAIYYAPAQTAPDTAGTYQLIWDSPSSTADAVEDLIVTYSALPNTDLCTLADVRENLELETTARDMLIQTCITAASRAIARRYQRQFAVLGLQTFTFECDSHLVNLAPCDLQATDDLVLTLNPGGSDELVLAAADFQLRPANASSGTYYLVRLRRGLVLPSMCDFGSVDLSITGVWGFPSIDEDVRRACVITASAWIDRSVETYEVPDVGTTGMNYVPARASTWAIPAAAHTLLFGFARAVVV